MCGPMSVLANGPVGSADFQAQARTRLGQALPGVAGEFGLLVGGEFVREAADHAGGIEPLGGHHDGVEHVGGRDHQQRDRLSLFFGDGDGGGEEFLLVVVEDLAGFHDRAAAEAGLAMVEAGAHHDHILLGGVGVGQHLAQVVEIAGIAHRNQNVSRAHAHGAAAQFLVAVDAELIELLRFAVTLFGNVALGEREDGEENGAENHSGDRSFDTW